MSARATSSPQSTLALDVARLASVYREQPLPPDVMGEAKTCLLDTLACALGGIDSDAFRIVVGTPHLAGSAGDASIIGVEEQRSCFAAVLANGVAVRFLDYNDTLMRPMPEGEQPLMAVHPSESIPALLALGEQIGASGSDLLRAIILAYEIGGRCVEMVEGLSIKERGFHQASLGAFCVAAAASLLLKSDEQQTANALGIAGTVLTLDIIDGVPHEPNTMLKNLAYPLAAQTGLQAALLAAQGFTGPLRIVEGYKGMGQVLMGGRYRPQVLGRRANHEFWITRVARKPYVAEHTTHGAVEASLEVRQELEIDPGAVTGITIRATKRCIGHTGDPDLQYALNKETADHSLPYVVAVALLDGPVAPHHYTRAWLDRPAVRDLAEKTRLEADESFEGLASPGEVTVTLASGASVRRRVTHPRGNPERPLGWNDVAAKFARSAAHVISDARATAIISKVQDAERLESVEQLMEPLRFAPAAESPRSRAVA